MFLLKKFAQNLRITLQTLKVFHFSKPAGFSIIKSYLPLAKQIELGSLALNSFCRKPNRTNLYIYEAQYKKKEEALYANAKQYNVDHFREKERYDFNRKIRWANLGYHYDWDNRCYYENKKSGIPEVLQDLVRR